MMLQVENLSRTIAKRTLFTGLSFSLDEGESLAISAPSGFGKTQVLRCLAHLVPFEGTITLDGKTAKEVGVPCWRRDIVYCAQVPPIYSGSPADFEALIGKFSSQLKREHMPAREIAKLWKVDHIWEKPWATLSGGEVQRASLALSLSTNPRLLLLDEPTSALDAATRDLVEERLSGHAAIWVTHDREQAARVASRVIDLGPYGVPHG